MSLSRNVSLKRPVNKPNGEGHRGKLLGNLRVDLAGRLHAELVDDVRLAVDGGLALRLASLAFARRDDDVNCVSLVHLKRALLVVLPATKESQARHQSQMLTKEK